MLDFADISRAGLDSAPSRAEIRRDLARAIRRAGDDQDALLNIFLAERRELLAEECDDLALARDDLIAQLAEPSLALGHVEQLISVSSESTTPLVLCEPDGTLHLREKPDGELALCVRPIAKNWHHEMPVGDWAASGPHWCWFCRKEMDEKVGSPVYLAARETSTLDRETLTERYLEKFRRRLKGCFLRDEIALRYWQGDAIAETAAPVIAARLLALSPLSRLHWMSSADGFGPGSTVREQIIDYYGEVDELAWPTEEALSAIYERLISLYWRSYMSFNLRYFTPIFVIAHLWPQALGGYEEGRDPVEHAAWMIAELER